MRQQEENIGLCINSTRKKIVNASIARKILFNALITRKIFANTSTAKKYCLMRQHKNYSSTKHNFSLYCGNQSKKISTCPITKLSTRKYKIGQCANNKETLENESNHFMFVNTSTKRKILVHVSKAEKIFVNMSTQKIFVNTSIQKTLLAMRQHINVFSSRLSMFDYWKQE